MKLLAIDTATEACSAALWLDGRVEQRFAVVGRGHTEHLPPMVAGLLAAGGVTAAQLDGVICGIGPGSFAGLRIGVGYVKGLALAADLPVQGVGSLELLAQASAATRIIAAIDARMSEVYVGVFERGPDGVPRSLRPDWVGAPATLPPLPGSWTGVGTGWIAYRPALEAASGATLDAVHGDALPRAADAFALARARPFAGADALVPRYVRNQVALTLEEQARQRR